MKRVWLVTGGSGQLGTALQYCTPSDVHIVAPDRYALDLCGNLDAAEPLLVRHGVTAIINCAAFTNVDLAEKEWELAFRVNAVAAGGLAGTAAMLGIPFVQVSTDYVFSGEKREPYGEDDSPEPLNVYGLSKLAGERMVSGSGARHAIVRSSWIFSSGHNNFVKTMRQLCREKDDVHVVADQRGRPTHARDLAGAITVVTSALERGHVGSGIWHVANAGETTWHGLARHIFDRAKRNGLATAPLHQTSSSAQTSKARRPANSSLCTRKLQRDFGLVLRSWRTAADEAIDELDRLDDGAGE